MKKSIFIWQLIGFIFTGIMGVILHFLFDWTNQSVIVAPFSAVNESTWEHMKILFFPMFIFEFIENHYIGNKYENFWYAKFVGIVLGVASIPVLFYTVNGIFGMTADWVNIAIFFVAAAISFLFELRFLNKDVKTLKPSGKALLGLCLIALVFVVFTFAPPNIPLFEDPITKTYGYQY